MFKSIVIYSNVKVLLNTGICWFAHTCIISEFAKWVPYHTPDGQYT